MRILGCMFFTVQSREDFPRKPGLASLPVATETRYRGEYLFPEKWGFMIVMGNEHMYPLVLWAGGRGRAGTDQTTTESSKNRDSLPTPQNIIVSPIVSFVKQVHSLARSFVHFHSSECLILIGIILITFNWHRTTDLDIGAPNTFQGWV